MHGSQWPINSALLRYEEMVEAMSAEAAKAKGATGDGMGKGVFYGPINNKMQVRI